MIWNESSNFSFSLTTQRNTSFLHWYNFWIVCNFCTTIEELLRHNLWFDSKSLDECQILCCCCFHHPCPGILEVLFYWILLWHRGNDNIRLNNLKGWLTDRLEYQVITRTFVCFWSTFSYLFRTICQFKMKVSRIFYRQ